MLAQLKSWLQEAGSHTKPQRKRSALRQRASNLKLPCPAANLGVETVDILRHDPAATGKCGKYKLIQYISPRICDQLMITVIHGFSVNSPSSNGSVFHVLPHPPSFGRLFEGFGLTNLWACQSQRCHRRRIAVAKMPHQQDLWNFLFFQDFLHFAFGFFCFPVGFSFKLHSCLLAQGYFQVAAAIL